MKATEAAPTDLDDGASVSTVNDEETENSEADSLSEETEKTVTGEACPSPLTAAPLVVNEVDTMAPTVEQGSPELVHDDGSMPTTADLDRLSGGNVAPEEMSPSAEAPRTEMKLQLTAFEPPRNKIVVLASEPSFQAAALGGAGGAVALGASGAAGGSLLGAAIGIVPAPFTL